MIFVFTIGSLHWSSQHPINRETGYSNVPPLPWMRCIEFFLLHNDRQSYLRNGDEICWRKIQWEGFFLFQGCESSLIVPLRSSLRNLALLCSPAQMPGALPGKGPQCGASLWSEYNLASLNTIQLGLIIQMGLICRILSLEYRGIPTAPV